MTDFDTADSAAPTPLHSGTPIGDAARAMVGARLTTVRKRLAPVRDSFDAADDDVHALRVATRRAASAVRVFEGVLRKRDRRAAGKTLRRLRRAATAARAADVHASMLLDMLGAASGPRLAAAGYAVGRIATERELGRIRLADVARRAGVKRTRRRHRALIENVRESDVQGAATFGELTQIVLADCFDRLELAMSGDLTALDRIHELRLMVKRFRYTLEVVEPCLDPASLDEALARARALQARLGELNDLAELEIRLEGYARRLEDDDRAPDFATLISGLRVLQGEIDRALRAKREAFTAWWGGSGGPAILASLRVSLLSVLEPPAEPPIDELPLIEDADESARAGEVARP